MNLSPTPPAIIFAAFGALFLTLPPNPVRGAETIDGLWSINPDDREYMTVGGNSERGVAYNPSTGNVLLVSRAAGAEIIVLDGADGAELRRLDTSIVFGGTFPLNMIGVADDGAVYACNLAVPPTGSVPNLKIYRWANDLAESAPMITFEGDPAGIDPDTGQSLNSQRWGDSIAVRGSGIDTQIVAASRASGAVAIFTTTDGMEFTPTIIPNAGGGQGSLSIAFGPGDTLYTTSVGTALRRVSFDLGTASATLLQDYPDAAFPFSVVPIAVDPAANRLGAVAFLTGPDRVELRDITDPVGAPIKAAEALLPIDNANLNGTGAVAFGPDRLYVLVTNNGLHAYEIEESVIVDPPLVGTPPASLSVIEGGSFKLEVGATGTPPFSYQWSRREGEAFVEIEGATSAEYVVDPSTLADAGEYIVTVTNDGGSATSDPPAVVTVVPRIDTDILEPLWQAAPGSRTYLETDSAQRGLAANPTNGNVLLVSRTGGPQIRVLDGATGADLHQLDVAGLTGGFFPLNMIGVADDGAVYACNLSLTGGDFKFYRWENDQPDTFPDFAFDAAFSGDPGVGRLGDTFAVRGAGASTQILAASRTTNQVVLFTTTDGRNFEPTVITVADASQGNFGLGLAFGSGNRFWGKATGASLRHVEFDPDSGGGVTLHDFPTTVFPSSIGPIAVDPDTACLIGISTENPDNVRAYDLADLTNPPELLDLEFFAADNANTNATGAAAFSAGRLFALGTNNGIAAFTVAKEAIPLPAPTITDVAEVSLQGAPAVRFQLNGTEGGTYLIESSTDGAAWMSVETVTLVEESEVFVYPITVPNRLYRVSPVDEQDQ